jgi:MFS transporter, CP family, cyanate transporter
LTGPATAGTPAPPSAPTHWPAVLAAVLGGVAIGMNVGKVPLALPALRAEFDLSLVQAGWVSSMLSTLAVASAVGFGLLAGRLGALRLVLIGLLLGAGASLAALLAPGHGLLIVTRFFEGAGFLAVAVAAPSLVSAASHPADRRFALGVWATYMPAGAGLAMALSPLLMGLAGWRGPWLAAAAMLLAAAAAAWWQRDHYGAAGGSSHRHKVQPGSVDAPLAVLRRRLPWLLALAFGAWALQHFALIVWLPTFLKEQRGLGDAQVAALTATMLLVNVPGNLIGGALVQRGVSRGRLIAAAHLATGLCGLGLAQDHWPDGLRYGLSVALSFIGGLIPAAVMSSSTVLARNPHQIGVLQGLIMQGSQLGQFIGTPLIAAVVAASGQWSSARWVTGAAAGLGLALGLAAHRLERRLAR